jgi:molecular chaperone GrpE
MSLEPPARTTKQRKRADERISELEAALAEANRKADSYLNQLRYAKADLDNLQKQTQRRAEEAVERANGRVIQELLTILDELTIVACSSEAKNAKLTEGLTMVSGKLAKLLEAEGVKPIEALGTPFDPYKHEAVVEVETSEEPNGYVIEEIRRGYTYKGKVLRASMVKVARCSESCEKKVSDVT